MQADIDARIATFKEDLRTQSLTHVLRRHVLTGPCYALSEAAHFDLREKVARQYGLHPNDVYVVGSSKLGFSTAPTKPFRHFGESSDVDLAVVSETLFDSMWRKVHYYCEHGGFWSQFGEFKDYLFLGWIRPDKLPPGGSFAEADRWWTFFNELSRSGLYSSYKIRGAIYRNLYFLESYQLRGISACKDKLS
jgi:hypothetical protein